MVRGDSVPAMSSPVSLSRRDFLRHTTTAGLALSLGPAVSSSSRAAAHAAGRRLNVAVIGTNSRGLVHVDALAGLPEVTVGIVCDVDDRALAKGAERVRKAGLPDPRAEKDFRRVLEDKSIDAVTMATPDHWHAPMAILALQAGKAVYLEKPCSHNPHEGELLLSAIRSTRGVVQMGNQRRSFPNLQAAIREIQGGAIGRAYFARAWYANKRGSIGRGDTVPVPAGLDYELWQGPAPRRPFRSNLIHYNWHWFWHWGTGEALNNGSHEVDVARWALQAGNAVRVGSHGGRYAFQDDWETPDTQVVSWDFPDGKSLTWEGRSCNPFPSERLERGVLVFGTEGSALLDGDSYTLFDKAGKVVKSAKSGQTADPTNTQSSTGLELDRLHFRNFVDAIRDGAMLASPISDASVSVNLLHLGNIAWRVGRSLDLDPATGRILRDDDAAKLWRRDYEPGWEPKV